MRYLTLAEILEIHRLLIEQLGENPTLRDMGAESEQNGAEKGKMVDAGQRRLNEFIREESAGIGRTRRHSASCVTIVATFIGSCRSISEGRCTIDEEPISLLR